MKISEKARFVVCCSFSLAFSFTNFTLTRKDHFSENPANLLVIVGQKITNFLSGFLLARLFHLARSFRGYLRNTNYYLFL